MWASAGKCKIYPKKGMKIYEQNKYEESQNAARFNDRLVCIPCDKEWTKNENKGQQSTHLFTFGSFHQAFSLVQVVHL